MNRVVDSIDSMYFLYQSKEVLSASTPSATLDVLSESRERSQCFKHSVSSTAFAPNEARSHDRVLLAPEKIRSGSADIGGILKISAAMRERLGHKRCWPG